MTAGRREQVRLTLSQIGWQTRKPDKIIVCPASPDDFDPACAASTRAPVEQVSAPRGICAQRNAVLDASRDADIIVFFDDDYYPAPDYLAHDVVMATP